MRSEADRLRWIEILQARANRLWLAFVAIDGPNNYSEQAGRLEGIGMRITMLIDLLRDGGYDEWRADQRGS